MKFFTSDPHFYHRRIIGFQATRGHFRDPNLPHVVDAKGEISHPWEIAAMNETLVARWNETVTNDDEIWCLGDFSFENVEQNSELLRSLKGKKYLVLGNHDHKRMNSYRSTHGFIETTPYAEIKAGNQLICMMHYPILSWREADRGSIHLHGHLHGDMHSDHAIHAAKYKTMDVGVDAHPLLRPFSLDEVMAKMDGRAPMERRT